MKKLSLLIASLMIASSASATVLSTSQYSVTALTGSWVGGSTGWNMGAPVTAASATTMLSNGYVDSFTHSVINGIYGNNSTITFGTIGGADVVLNTFSFITSRNYSNATVLSLDYSLNNGAWMNAQTMTSGALLAPLSPCLSVANNDCAGKTASMNFGDVVADKWRLSLTGGEQVSLHEVMIDTRAVPEPGSVALLGLGLAGLVAMRRKKTA